MKNSIWNQKARSIGALLLIGVMCVSGLAGCGPKAAKKEVNKPGTVQTNPGTTDAGKKTAAAKTDAGKKTDAAKTDAGKKTDAAKTDAGKKADAAIESLWRAIESGQAVDMLTARIQKRQAEKKELETQLAVEQNKRLHLTEPQVRAFLDYVRSMPSDSVEKKRAIINIFVHSVYLYDDHFTLIINASKRPLHEENIPLDDIEGAFEGVENKGAEGCSNMTSPAPPKTGTRFGVSLFLCGAD